MRREAFEALSRETTGYRARPAAAFTRDPRPLDERLACFAERGAIAPESLSLTEIRMVCEAWLRAQAELPE